MCFILFSINIYSQQVFYTEDFSNIANQERGLYYYTTGDSDSFTTLNQTELTNLRVNQKVTLIWRTYYMMNFTNSNISQSYLNNILSDLNTARLSGVKLIIRFAYSESNLDANKAFILSHINQLKPVLNINQDVISSLEAGFIGEYGEWYDSSNYGNTDNLTATQLANRIEIGNKIFELCPKRNIAFRTPSIMRSITGNNAITNEQAYNNSNASRMSYHNDCFLRTGWEGFTNTTNEYSYLDSQTRFTIAGGESCGLISPSTDCSNALLTLERFHFNYLNMSYHPDVWNNWQVNNCKSEIINRLGYRFVLLNSYINNNAISITLENKGFGNLVNDRKAYIVYKNIATGQEFSILLNTDPNFWQCDVVNGSLIYHVINNNLPNGNYRLYLNLPDIDIPTNPIYSIRCANENTWEESTGYNNLNQTVIINNLTVKAFIYNDQLIISNIRDYEFNVYNILGQELNKNNHDLSNLPKGIYIIKIYNKEEKYTLKIYKE